MMRVVATAVLGVACLWGAPRACAQVTTWAIPLGEDAFRGWEPGLRALLPTADGRLVAATTWKDRSTFALAARLTELGNDGTILRAWQRSSPGDSGLLHGASASDGALFVAGFDAPAADGPRDAWFARLDATTLATTCETTLDFGGIEHAHVVLATDSGAAIIVGSGYDGATPTWVARVAADCSVAWAVALGDTGAPLAVAATLLADGAVLVGSGGLRGAGLICLEPDGTVRSERSLPLGRAVKGLQADGPSRAIVLGRASDPAGGDDAAWWASLDTALGTITEEHALQHPDGGAEAWAILPTPSGWTLFGRSPDLRTASYQHIMAVSMRPDRVVTSAAGIGDGTDAYPWQVRAEPGGGFLMAATTALPTLEPGPQRGLAMRTDDLGHADSACILEVPTRLPAPLAVTTALAPASFGAAPATPATRAPAGPWLPMTIAPPCAGCRVDGLEPDDSAASPAAVAWPDAASGTFCDDPEDWAPVSACAGETLHVKTSRLSSGADTVLEIRTGDGTVLLARDDLGADGVAAELTWTAPATGAYVLGVLQADGAFGPGLQYDLTIQRTPPPPSGPTWRLDHVGPSGAVAVTALASAGDGSAYLLGTGPWPATPGDSTWVARQGADGAIAWIAPIRVAGPTNWVPDAIAAAAAGGCVVVGHDGRPGSTEGQVVTVTRLDGDGREAWVRTLSVAGTRMAISQQPVCVLDDGTVAVAWRDPASGAACVARLDAGGRLASAWSVPAAAASAPPLVSAGLASDLVMVSATTAREALVMRFLPDGTAVFAGTLAVPSALGQSLVRLSDDGHLLLLGRTSGQAAIRIDRSGSVTAAWSLGSTNLRAIERADELAPGRWLLRGRAGAAGIGRGLLAELDVDGAVRWAQLATPSTGAVHDAVVVAGAVLAATTAGLLRLDDLGGTEAGCEGFVPNPLFAEPLVLTSGAASANPAPLSVDVAPASSMPGAPALSLIPACTCSCGATRLPPETGLDLRVRAPGWISWGPTTTACEDRLYRGDVARIAVTPADCIRSGIRSGLALDPALPGAGNAYFYLVCGATTAGQGSLGFDSLGTERGRGTACP